MIKHILVVDYHRDEAESILKDMRDELLSSEVGSILKDEKNDFQIKTNIGDVVRIVAKKQLQSIRGMKWNGIRPNMLVVGNLDIREGERERNWLYKALLPALSQDCKYMGMTRDSLACLYG